MTPERRERMSPEQDISDRNHSRGSPNFGGGVGYQENEAYHRGHIPESTRDAAYHRGHIPESNRASPRLRIPPGFHQKIRFLEVALYIQWNR